MSAGEKPQPRFLPGPLCFQGAWQPRYSQFFQKEDPTLKRILLSVCSLVIFLAGICVLAYPAVSNLYYENQQDKLTAYYESQVVEKIPEQDRSAEFQACWDYNASLIAGGVLLTDPFDAEQLDPTALPYANLLNPEGDGAMGYITIPVIDVNLVIYHGVGEDVLQKGVGHLQGTSMPVGGTGSHCVLSAHTGLNSKKLFTDLDQLIEGDIFYLHILGQVLAYQVDQIKVVQPYEVEDLAINAQQDYVTLVTCTPYGINTHRLLVRGTRIPYEEAQAAQQAASPRPVGSTWRQQYIRAIALGLGLLLALVLVRIQFCRARKRRAQGRDVR